MFHGHTSARAFLTAAVLAGSVALATGSSLPAAAETAGGAAAPAELTASHLDAGVDHTCAVFTTNAVRCWGRNDRGQLGYGDINPRGDSPGEIEALANIDLGTGRTAKSVSAGWGSSCAILDNNTLRCWGRNDRGQLGLGAPGDRGDNASEMGDSLPTVNLGTGRTAIAVSVGDYDLTAFACAILDNAKVKCWGDNTSGQLGIGVLGGTRGLAAGEMGDALPYVNLGTGRTVKAISVGSEHACAILDNDTLKCWGNNVVGQLGLGDNEYRGGIPGEMGDALPAVNLGLGRTATAIASSFGHSCAILDNGTVKCWGDNSAGQLGTGDGNDYGGTPGSPVTGGPVLDMAYLPAVSEVVGTPSTSVPIRATTIAAGYQTSCAVLTSGLLTCWGDGVSGQLGNGTSATAVGNAVPPYPVAAGKLATAVTLGEDHACASANDGAIRCWGIDDGGRLGRNTATLALVTTPPATPINFRNGSAALLVEVPVISVPTPTTNKFVSLVPTRILDTRSGLGTARRPLAANGEIVLQVAGTGGVPIAGATAVVLNITADQAADAGFVTVYPADVTGLPTVSSLNLTQAGQTVANLVTVQLSTDGKLKLYSTVSTHLLADVAGYYTPAASATAGRFVALNPERLFDTRSTPGFAKLGAASQIDVKLLGRLPVPASGVDALVLNVTVSNTNPGFLSVWPFGLPLPTVSNLNITTADQAIANQVIVPVGAGGKVSFYSSDGADVIVDVAGYFTDTSAASSTSGLFTPVVPRRIFDTRNGSPAKLGPSAAARTAVVTMNGKGNLPSTGMSAVVMNLTATDTGTGGFVIAWPSSLPQPLVSTLNWSDTGDTVPNHAIVRVSASGQASFFASSSTQLLADSAGWYS
jgi:alpha-tubulin suppressor-like RCC1 family protein